MKVSMLARLALCATVALFVSTATFAAKKKDAENAYPNATRTDPKGSMSERDGSNLNKATDFVNDGEGDKAEPIITKVLENKRATDYAKAFAHQLMAQIYWDKDQGDQAIAEYKQAIALDALPNDAHFQVVYALAQTELQMEKYQDAIATLNEWEKLTGTQTADELALKSNCYYRLDQYQQAIDTMKQAKSMATETKESWNQILMASFFELEQYDEAAKVVEADLAARPDDFKLIKQLATIYVNGDNYPKAIEVLTNAKNRNLITNGEDYVQLAKLYTNADKPKDGAATLKEGMAKKLVAENYENTKLLGDICSQAEDDPCAIEAYNKASAQAPDGNVDYQLGYLLFYAERNAEAKVALERALKKGGLRQQGEAYVLLGDVESYAGNDAAALAAWKQALAFPSAKEMAQQRIKTVQSGGRLKRSSK